MIKKILYISLYLMGLILMDLTSIEANAYEASVESHFFNQQDIPEFDNTIETDIKEYIDTEEQLAHGHGRRHLRYGRCCHSMVVPFGPPRWGRWGWYQPTRVVSKCHFVEPVYRSPPRHRVPPHPRPRRPRDRRPPDRDRVENTYCDYLDAGDLTVEEENPLFNAICDGRASVVRRLIRDGYLVNRIGFTGETPLILATKLNNRRMVRLLLENDADVCMKAQGSTAIDWAYDLGYRSILRRLEERSSRCF